ncbi:Putative uncharacterized protein [Moritella viscosa]|uniref:type II toxin-antitoxin system YafO family toxin n=1 Tax=Moritella viscosa TaxID=80854 RepID=UPI0005D354B9|nr:type II toxin-antitoxin system YafO family toxin [Moritella viscosa]SGY90809.1 Putative uncharacterized protein [Moritella viscosa]SHO03086.1 Putative uncharacterized protein [Moritella viscosa]SHO03172.1 Putative uncharacterized protein [Moritella viscosa]SHO03970.1 Putative uncharacterized protein [Moritella viscosa]SHO05283.1 Putative uncharacterized protein [Moritella viscosa]
MKTIQTAPLFRFDPDWEKHRNTFDDYINHNIQPDFYGRDATLSHPHISHIHLAQTQALANQWSRKARIDQIYYRTTKSNDPENDYWLIYAYDDFNDSYLLLTIIGPNAHGAQWRSYLSTIYVSIVEPWINGRLADVI